jgi:hypothetical protein
LFRKVNPLQNYCDCHARDTNHRVFRGNFELACKSGSRWLTAAFVLLPGLLSSTSLVMMLLITLSARVEAEPLQSMDASQVTAVAPHGAKQNTLAGPAPGTEAQTREARPPQSTTENTTAKGELARPVRKPIVVGFLGGKVHASNLLHREAQLIETLQQGYPHAVHAAIFANRDGDQALRTVLKLLDQDGDGQLSDAEKNAARIVIFGHSWGASETVALADRLNKLNIPVLLTIQVDSVRKQSQNDEQIPPNVREAVNFYQSEGLLRGRTLIVAADPKRTKILGNHESSYRENAVSCAGFPWYARAFMKQHIQIENDPVVWDKIQALILARIL